MEEETVQSTQDNTLNAPAQPEGITEGQTVEVQNETPDTQEVQVTTATEAEGEDNPVEGHSTIGELIQKGEEVLKEAVEKIEEKVEEAFGEDVQKVEEQATEIASETIQEEAPAVEEVVAEAENVISAEKQKAIDTAALIAKRNPRA